MLLNYFKTAWRNLLKSKFYSIINITGLAIGLAVGVMILLWVQNEMSYDRFHQQSSSIYKINSFIGGNHEQVWSTSPGPLAVYTKESVPDIAQTVRVKENYAPQAIVAKGEKYVEPNTAYVDSNFFRLFTLPMLSGSVAHPFNGTNSVIITSTIAQKYFGTSSAVGQTLTVNKEPYTITGVMADFPANSTMQYQLLYPMSRYAKEFIQNGGNGDWKTIDEDLGNYAFNTYVQLQPHAQPATAIKKITDIYWKHRGGIDPNGAHFTLQSLASLHLVGPDGSKHALQTARIFFLIAILILVIACINYVNLSTARSMQRVKEVSMRKIIGAARAQLFIQFIIESAVLFTLATLLAFGLIYALLPLYNNISGKQLYFNLFSVDVWMVTGSAIAGTLLLSAIYPALLLSSFKPMQALKGKLTTGMATTTFRKALVVTQFVCSIGLIIATVIIARQLKFMREKNLGFNKEQVFSFGLNDQTYAHQDVLLHQLQQHPGVLATAVSDNTFAGVSSITGDTDWEGKAPKSSMMINQRAIDEHFIPLLQLKMAEGGNFTGIGDSLHYILNETAVKQMGITSPIGKRFSLHNIPGIIIGVVKDYNFASLKTAIDPVILTYEKQNYRIFVKTTPKDAASVITIAQNSWQQLGSDFPFQYSFLDAEFDKMYRSDNRAGTLFNVFAAVAVIISALGLLGLATYTTQVKTKEVGIRKVLGASITQIVTLLAKEFVLLVLLAFAIASPIAWLAMHSWLESYTYRISIQWWMFAGTAGIAIGITLLTIGHQAIKAAFANPVKSLKTE
ncbi:FtsX-like permease family protein [Filimonas lacunae]|uniref:FtsX-like permease family protein n=1 Tax=Filimonas lacunae TaxID=477680 RepID=A0A173MJZ0_9BACT|nr:ABC transporter permease [Filimonas lacunae]BAV07914.1 ABC transporter, permease protein [Filimonas lacunae]SIT06462.1 FtsX-like permease family protein [Filimonas lacunae]